MKICAIICEFNPFHNGHAYLLQQAKEKSGCDFILCIMSGDFTQRGEMCVADKYTRAKHAVYGGADCVIELPAAFAVAPAEVFARGAVKILSSIPEISTLCFGCESGDKRDFLTAAKILCDESEQFRNVLCSNLRDGQSYVKSYAAAFESVGGNADFLQKPNNILAVEYVKALLRANARTEILPIRRVGAGYGDEVLRENFSSATAIRKNLQSEAVAKNVPEHVMNDLKKYGDKSAEFENAARLVLSRTEPEGLKKVYGCGEGLENALKSLQSLTYGKIIDGATSKRYSSSRIKRILCANLLGLYESDCKEFLSSPLYVTPLAAKKQCADEIFSALSKSCYPVITGGDYAKLDAAAKKCKSLDDFAHTQWQIIAGLAVQNKMILI